VTARDATAPAIGAIEFDGGIAVPRRGARAAYVAVFLAFFDNFALLPLIAPRAQELGADALGVGITVAAYSLTNLVLNLAGGVLTDRFGRRLVVLTSLAVAPICIAAYGLADSFAVLLAARIVHGAFGGFLMAALFAMLADAAPEGERGRTIGRAGALIGLAAIIGPAAAGFAAQRVGSEPVFLAVAAILALGFLAIGTSIPETLPRDARVARSPGAWRRLLSDPRLRLAYLVIFGMEAAVGIVTGFLKDGIIERQLAAGMDAERALRYATGAQGGLFSVFAIVAVVLMLSPIARQADRRGALGLSVAGIVALGISTTVLAISSGIEMDMVAMVMYGLGFGLLFPAAAATVGIAAAWSERGRAYGLFNLSFDAGLAFGPLAAGALAVSALGLDPFVAATILLAIVAGLIPFVTRGRPAPG
jgi:DHA1 family multidrug resistance protein-like MFS transporter